MIEWKRVTPTTMSGLSSPLSTVTQNFTLSLLPTHTLCMERDAHRYACWTAACPFQSTRSAWSVTDDVAGMLVELAISIHTLRMERDWPRHRPPRSAAPFQSTRSAWSVTRGSTIRRRAFGLFQSTRSAWSVTADGVWVNGEPNISIHTLRMERDFKVIQRRA